MQVSDIRLECLKLAHRHDQSADVVVVRARAFEQYVTEGQRGTLTLDPTKAGNPKTKRAG